jgi:hypothetical protein
MAETFKETGPELLARELNGVVTEIERLSSEADNSRA